MGLSTIIFIRGRNYIVMLIAVEVIFLGLSLMFYCYYMSNPNHLNHDMLFAAFAMLILAAAESAVALALISALYKKTKNIVITRK